MPSTSPTRDPDLARVLLITGDARAAGALDRSLRRAGHTVAVLATAAAEAADADAAEVVVLPLHALALLRAMRERRRDGVSVVLADFPHAADVAEALRLGAVEVLTLPLRAGASDLVSAVAKAAELHALIAGTGVLADEPLRLEFPDEPPAPAPRGTLSEAMVEPERRIIRGALDAEGWNRSATARRLGIDRTTLYKKIRALGLDTPQGTYYPNFTT